MRRRPNTVALACLVVLAFIIALLTMSPGRSSGIFLADDNPGPYGGQALARVLQGHGVTVRSARDAGEVGEALTPRSTVFVVGRVIAGSDHRDELIDATRGAGRIVVVEPDESLARDLGLPEHALESDQRVVTGHTRDGAEVDAVLDASMFENATISSGDNAAQAIRLLGASDDLVWIARWGNTATSSDEDAAARGLRWPAWKTPLTWALFLTVVVLALARGRRFGPLVTEPLPVTVPATETVRSLAALYRRSTTREPAAAALRAGSARRVGARLALPAPARTADGVASALREAAGATRAGASSASPLTSLGGLTAAQAHELADRLTGPTPADDRELATLATTLAHLEKEMTS